MTRTARRLAVVSLLVLVSCTSPPNPSQATGVSSIPRGGTMRVVESAAFGYVPGGPPAVIPDATTLDPASPFDFGAAELLRCCLGRGLFSYTGQPADRGGAELRPDLARAMPEVSGDGLTWTIHIRPGIRYAPPLQRTEIVAADFIRSFQRFARLIPGGVSPFFSIVRGFDEFADGKTSSVGGLETPDPHTLVVRLAQPEGDVAYRIGLWPAPLPSLPGDPTAPYGVATGHDKDYGAFIVSSGPYMVEGSEKLDFDLPPGKQLPLSGLVPGKSITLVRNPSWSAANDQLRPAYADRIELVYTPTNEDAAAMVDRREADLELLGTIGPSAQVPPAQIRAYESDRRRGRIEVDPIDAIEYLSMNLAVPPFDDLHVRRAVAFAIDRAALVHAYGGPLAGSRIGHIALDSMEDDALRAFDPYWTKDAASRVAAARKEMALSAYDADHDGICDAAACRHIPAISRSNRPAETTDVITRSLADIGIMIDVRPLGTQEFFSQVYDPKSKTPIGFLWTLGGKDYPNAGDWLPNLFESSGIGAVTPYTNNFSLVGATADQLRGWGYAVTRVPNLDDRLAQCVPLVGPVQTRCWTALDAYIMENVVALLPLISINKVQIIPSRVVSYSYDSSVAMPALDRIAVKH